MTTETIRIFYGGDIVSSSGRAAVKKYIPTLKEDYKADLIVMNGENSAHGFGITPDIAQGLYEAGVDGITLGNHSFSNKSINSYINDDPRLIRPLNMPEGTPGKGYTLLPLKDGQVFLIMQVLGIVFMPTTDKTINTFTQIDTILEKYKNQKNIAGSLLDIHGEASSEKIAMARYYDGRISGIVGTHTHIPTADTQILPKGTGYQTDIGMTGVYDSVIGMTVDSALSKIKPGSKNIKLEPAKGEAILCGILLQLDKKTRLTTQIERIRLGAPYITKISE